MLLTDQFELGHELFLNEVVLKLLDAPNIGLANRKSSIKHVCDDLVFKRAETEISHIEVLVAQERLPTWENLA